MLLVHPDYVAHPGVLPAFRRFLDRYMDDPTAWQALPREVSAWWRRRAASRLEPEPGGWRIVGPAADEATVRYA
jgi:hypothetical protein